MTSGPLDDDRCDNDAGVAPLDGVARVGSDDFVDSILSMAERRADEVDLAADAPDPVSHPPVATTPVASRLASGDFVDDVLEVAETRAAAAMKETAEKRPPSPQPTPALESGAARSDLRNPSINVTVPPASPVAVSATTPAAVDVAPREVGDAVPNADFATTVGYEHPTRPTPWWRKRPSLEVIFAVIATVLMVIGLALVIAELF